MTINIEDPEYIEYLEEIKLKRTELAKALDMTLEEYLEHLFNLAHTSEEE